MQGAEYKVAGLSRCQRQADGFQIPELTNQDDVGVFPQGRAQCFVEAQSIPVHFPLVHQAFL